MQLALIFDLKINTDACMEMELVVVFVLVKCDFEHLVENFLECFVTMN